MKEMTVGSDRDDIIELTGLGIPINSLHFHCNIASLHISICFTLILIIMDAIHQELVFNFSEMCGCDLDIAQEYLDACGWELNTGNTLMDSIIP